MCLRFIRFHVVISFPSRERGIDKGSVGKRKGLFLTLGKENTERSRQDTYMSSTHTRIFCGYYRRHM